jgi:hypothetical protein
LWQPDPVQSDAKSWAGALPALKFSPREVPAGAGGRSCANVPDSGHSDSTAASTAAQNRKFGGVRRVILANKPSLPAPSIKLEANPVLAYNCAKVGRLRAIVLALLESSNLI